MVGTLYEDLRKFLRHRLQKTAKTCRMHFSENSGVYDTLDEVRCHFTQFVCLEMQSPETNCAKTEKLVRSVICHYDQCV